MLRSHAVDEEPCRSDQHGDEQDAKSHLRFADVVVLSRQVGGEAVGGEGQGYGSEKSDGVGDGDEAAVFLLPGVRGRGDLHGEGVVKCQRSETDIYTYMEVRK